MTEWWLLGCFVVGFLFVKWVLRNLNVWYYERKLGERRYELPPGDLGWPFIGNLWPFLRAFKSGTPESFISGFVDRFGHGGMYKAHMFGNPSIIVTSAEACRKILTDDEAFKPGWPSSAVNLIGKNSFIDISPEEHRWLRRLTAAPINGHEMLSLYMKYIEENIVVALEKMADMGQIEILTELRRLTFRIIMYIFLSSESEEVMEVMEREYTALNYGLRAMAINIPGLAYHSSLKARKRLVGILQSIVTSRRRKNQTTEKKDMMDALLDAEDEHGRRLRDEDIIDILVMYLNAGHESSGHMMMWAVILLQNNPHVFKRAKAEQEEIMKRRPVDQKGVTLKEIREMTYLSKVIDEALRIISISVTVFREANRDVHVCGYTIPKGWRAIVWFRSIHLDPETYPEPTKFDPSRWDGFIPKAGSFVPFGAGTRLCPGNDLAKIEITIFLHHFLLNYKLERHNPDSPLLYLPHVRPKDNCVGRIRRVSTK